ncbi:PASTA domain-containing protein [Alloprevotella sp. OH1205_COT-284]|uniref:PASTA domain-containing protein n=1 Tax=Alloprevotella sp. OH1205_COT-284 TaxID=2491043 RepID=UPI000F5DFCC4|nr:PASTA domain-containing protein [Alloprevotella sp. OH1205_COT-284]RRD76939.1 PASTA domain-containing protein [Alloprevotella sp. OH1205_COT-284]
MTFREFFSKLTAPVLWGNLLAMVIILALLIVGLFVFLDHYTHHGQTLTVPDVRGQRCEVAIRKLEALGMRVEVSDTGYNTRLAADVILDQNLHPGTEVKLNRLIQLVVNASTARKIALPDIADNCSYREAQIRLESIGFKLAPVKRIYGDKDWVYRVEVLGREVHKGDRLSIELPLTLVVGDGEREEEFNGNDSLDNLYFHNDTLNQVIID